VVGIRAFTWLVSHASILHLTAKYGVRLHCMLIVKPFALHIALAFLRNVQQFKSSSLPPIVAAIDKFINSAVEASFNLALP